MISNDFYTKLIKRRRAWTPVELSSVQTLPNVKGVEDCIGRCLSLRKLELEVGEWVRTASMREKRYLTPEVVRLLELNIEDEERHDKALEYAYRAHRHLVTPEIEAEAEKLMQEWKDLAAVVHPLEVVWTLEASVFFIILPIFRRLGSAGLRTVANDISNDEAVHVATHRTLAYELGINSGTVKRGYTLEIDPDSVETRRSTDGLSENTYVDIRKSSKSVYGDTYAHPDCDALRARSVAWIVQNLDPETRSGSDFWRFQSENLYYTGKATGLKDTGRSVYQAFFEKSNLDIPKYA